MFNIKKSGGDEMTLNEVLKLTDWLKSKGFTDKAIHDCLEYIANTKRKKPTDTRKK